MIAFAEDVSGITVSFEFFPPKSEADENFWRTIRKLETVQPSFVSVTYGAGGSTHQRTREVVSWVRKETTITPMAHLTCAGHTRARITELLESYRSAAIENILALGGDPPAGATAPVEGDYRYAIELIDDLDRFASFSVGVAAHPEVHPRSPDRATDRIRLAEKLRRADFAITQFFFEAEHYVRLVDELAALGVDKPVLPGIMPVTNTAQIHRMAQLSGAALPTWLVEQLEAAGDDPEEVRRIGVAAATELCAQLLDAGAPGLHFYTMNQAPLVVELCERLGFTPKV